MELGTDEFTLAAAVLAALTSVYGVFSQRRSELREAHRKSLDEYISDLSRALHEVVASTDILLRAKSEESERKWLARAHEARDTIKGVRPALRYALWGISGGLKRISLLPDWVYHKRADADVADKILKRGDRLRRALDYTIRRCYSRGRTPTVFERFLVKVSDWHFGKASSKEGTLVDKGDTID
ncbi:MAG: hypothetical protein AAFP18_09040 [Bacteroidota bacterium]